MFARATLGCCAMKKFAIFLACITILSVRARAAEHPVPLGKNPDSSVCLQCHSDKNQGKHVHSAIAMGCTTCHDVTTAKGVTLISLVSPANTLCFTCHDKSSDKVLHGPYAEGLCVTCHSPHSSKYPDQLLTDQQDLCLGCHARARLKVNRRKQTVKTPWGVTLTSVEMQGWHFLNLNKTLTDNHPVAGHPVTGPNSALGKGQITCLSCHQPHASNKPNLLPANVRGAKPGLAGLGDYPTSLCETCHKPPAF